MDAASKSEGSGPDWDTIHGLMEDAIYGGRVDNLHDMSVLQTYLNKYVYLQCAFLAWVLVEEVEALKSHDHWICDGDSCRYFTRDILGKKGSGEVLKGFPIPNSNRFDDYLSLINQVRGYEAFNPISLRSHNVPSSPFSSNLGADFG